MGKLAAVILAAAGGFIAGILLASKSGKETRQEIEEKTNEYKAKAHESLETILQCMAGILLTMKRYKTMMIGYMLNCENESSDLKRLTGNNLRS